MSRGLVIGVDPGAKGAWAALRLDPELPRLVAYGPLPTRASKVNGRIAQRLDGLRLLDELRGLDAHGRLVGAAIEDVSARPSDTVWQAFSFGWSFGAAFAVLDLAVAGSGRSDRLVRVPPAVWRQNAGVDRASPAAACEGTPADQRARYRWLKAASRRRAQELWPDRAAALEARRADIAEAALIALASPLITGKGA